MYIKHTHIVALETLKVAFLCPVFFCPRAAFVAVHQFERYGKPAVLPVPRSRSRLRPLPNPVFIPVTVSAELCVAPWSGVLTFIHPVGPSDTQEKVMIGSMVFFIPKGGFHIDIS